MKRNKKGFTLIELLAVIVILAIIALIAVPVIMNILNKANKSAFKDTAYGLISAGELYFAEQQLELTGMSEEVEFTFPNDIGTLQVKGNVPDGTKLYVNKKGQVALGMTNGRYCITKGYSDTDITVTEDSENCYFPFSFKALTTTEHECTAKGQICDVDGTAFTIKVNDSETQNFYVIADDGNKVTLIMDRNLGNKVSWISETDYTKANADDNTDCPSAACNDEGPITAINYLDGLTDEEWSNITPKEYTYSGLDNNGTRKYEDITRTMRARMLTYSEANAIQTANNVTLPGYMYGGTDYWTSTAYSYNSYGAWSVYYNGTVHNSFVYSGGYSGVRPVIELTK